MDEPVDDDEYVVTAQKPTVVTHSCVGHFTSNEYYDLILAKSTHLEIYKIDQYGIELMGGCPIYGKISMIKLIHPKEEALAFLFIVTERLKACIVQWDSTSALITRSVSKDLSDHRYKRLSNCQICTVDPDGRFIGLFLYEKVCKVVQLDNSGQLGTSLNICLETKQVEDIKFLHGCAKPTLAVLNKAKDGARYAKTYEVNIESGLYGCVHRHPWARYDLDNGANLLIPIPTPLCGVLIIGEERIVYCGANTSKEISKTRSKTKAYGRVDGFRYLLGDGEGFLHLLVVAHDNQRATGLTYELMGETSIASTISYLENSLVFVGSSCGDSQLIKVDLEAKGSGVQVLKNFVNLGPIADLCVVDLERNGKAQVVTCSGDAKDGSLRIVYKGISELASIELQGITGLWSLRSSIGEAFDTFLVVSFIGETRILAMNLEEELEETEIEGFLSQVRTLFCQEAVHNQLVQVTSYSVRLVSSTTRKLVSDWDAPDGLTVSIATGNASQVLLASEDYVFYFEVGNGILTEMKRIQLDNQASCLNINPIGTNPNFSEVASVGKWTDESVEIRKLPDLTLVTKEKIGGLVTRSVRLCAFEGTSYLLCGLADGNLIIFQLDKDTGDIVDRQKISVGTQPINLIAFSLKSVDITKNILASSDRSTVIYSSNQKLLFKDLDLEDFNCMCQFNCATFPDSIAIATSDKLTLGNINATQKELNIRTIPLKEYACCICHQAQTCTYGICTANDSGTHFVRLLEERSLNVLSSYTLGATERGLSIVSCFFTGDNIEYYCVGTEDTEPVADESDTDDYIDLDVYLENGETKGRILVFKVEKRELQLIAEKETKGSVYSVNAFKGKLLAAINSKSTLYNWMLQPDKTRELQYECSDGRFLDIVDLQTREDLIVVGTRFRAICAFIYKPGVLLSQGNYVDETGNSRNSIAAVQILDDNIYLCADHCSNLYTVKENVKKDKLAVDDNEEDTLVLADQYHLGEIVIRFCHGSIGRGLRDGRVSTSIFGTSSGMIGVIASLPRERFGFLEKMQSRMSARVEGIGGLNYNLWRSFCSGRERSKNVLHTTFYYDTERKENVMHAHINFIDGDLIESFLHLSLEKKEDISIYIGVPVEELVRMVEELTRLH